MCFSPTASFVTAAVAGSAGVVALSRARSKVEIPLASMPLYFAFQQTIEGFLWLNLPVAPNAPVATTLTQAFLLFALVFWPIYAPVSALVFEKDPRRRRAISLCVLAGLAVGIYFLISMSLSPRTASIDGGHIVYSADPSLPSPIVVLYPIATCLSLVLSSFPIVRGLGVLIFAGSVISYIVYWNAFSSVWCFFAAAASGLIILHFEKIRRQYPVSMPQA